MFETDQIVITPEGYLGKVGGSYSEDAPMETGRDWDGAPIEDWVEVIFVEVTYLHNGETLWWPEFDLKIAEMLETA